MLYIYDQKNIQYDEHDAIYDSSLPLLTITYSTPPQIIDYDISFINLPSGIVSDWMIAMDGYGNVACVTNTQGATTDLDFILAYQDGILNAEFPNDNIIHLYSTLYITYNNTETAVYNNTDNFEMPNEFDIDASQFTAKRFTLNSFGYAEMALPDYDGGTPILQRYYFKGLASCITDPDAVPSITCSGFTSAGKIYITAAVDDSVGITGVTFNADGDIRQHDYNGYMTNATITEVFDVQPGQTMTCTITAYNINDKIASTEIGPIRSSTIMRRMDLQIKPEFDISCDLSGNISVKWTSWENALPPVSGFVYPPTEIAVYRKTPETDYTCIYTFQKGTKEYISGFIDVPPRLDIYRYRIVGRNQFGASYSVEFTADTELMTSGTGRCFIEEQLDALPSWTAARGK